MHRLVRPTVTRRLAQNVGRKDCPSFESVILSQRKTRHEPWRKQALSRPIAWHPLSHLPLQTTSEVMNRPLSKASLMCSTRVGIPGARSSKIEEDRPCPITFCPDLRVLLRGARSSSACGGGHLRFLACVMAAMSTRGETGANSGPESLNRQQGGIRRYYYQYKTAYQAIAAKRPSW